ncbi:hypothetical protein NC653_021431 [Populus alba x Populus x berolinensis]|uniref:Uncharacterized protein n=1 Tax=Populus alba x Populus x berolinensis TaxID=444605 RepID=A0AAD6QDW8_9ROSI|nr:hypothetical protein NC653_021431 [Populus alba x Populus x berolinensis]
MKSCQSSSTSSYSERKRAVPINDFKVLASEKKNQPRLAVVFTIGSPAREMTHAQMSSMKPGGGY